MTQVIHEVVLTPFQIAMDCQHVPDQADHICWNCTLKIINLSEAAEARAAALEAERDALNARCETLQTMYRSDHDQRIAQEEQIKQLESEIEYLRSTDHAADTDDETPLGKALDGLGDEVEP